MSAKESIAQPVAAKPGRLLWLWIASFGILGLLGVFSWFVLGPYLEVRKVFDQCQFSTGAEVVEKLGGARATTRKLNLFRRLPDRLVSRENKERAVGFMGSCGSEAVPLLLELLGSEDHRTRRAAAFALGFTRDSRAIEPLIATALRDPDEEVRLYAVESLDHLGSSGNVAVFIAVLKNDPAMWVRKSAAGYLGRTRDSRAFAPLIGALGDKESVVRRYAAEGLGNLGDAGAFAPLVASLGDKEEEVRRAAASALGVLGDPRAIPALETFANGSKEDYIRSEVA